MLGLMSVAIQSPVTDFLFSLQLTLSKLIVGSVMREEVLGWHIESVGETF